MKRAAPWSLVAAVVLVGGVWRLCGACGAGHAPAGVTTVPYASQRDDRHLAELLGNCAESGFYDRELADLVPVLLDKLEHAQPTPLKRAKEELGALGAQAFPGLANAFHRSYSDMVHSASLENAVDALAFNDSEESHGLLLEALQHPQESVRGKALEGLRRLARPADFDLLVERLAIESKELKRQTVPALFIADRARAEDLFLDYIARGVERALWLQAAPELATTARPEAGRRCAELFPSLEPVLAVHLAVGAARMGEREGETRLALELRAEEVQRRLAAVSAAQRAGLYDPLEYSLLEDPSADVRAIAVAALTDAPQLSSAQTSWLRAALNDASPLVRAGALKALCARGDEEGLARALVELEGEPDVLQPALQALREPMRRDHELARRALERLLQRHALEEQRPVGQRTASFKGIGQVPLREAAEFLHRAGVEAGAEKIESLRAHDWLMIQAANTDVEGRTFLAAALAEEQDPLRRLDLIDAVGSIRDELARRTLLAFLEQGARSPWERLLAASALIKVGPSWEVAPVLKRVCFAMQAPEEIEARRALQCQLWRWY